MGDSMIYARERFTVSPTTAVRLPLGSTIMVNVNGVDRHGDGVGRLYRIVEHYRDARSDNVTIYLEPAEPLPWRPGDLAGVE